MRLGGVFVCASPLETLRGDGGRRFSARKSYLLEGDSKGEIAARDSRRSMAHRGEENGRGEDDLSPLLLGHVVAGDGDDCEDSASQPGQPPQAGCTKVHEDGVGDFVAAGVLPFARSPGGKVIFLLGKELSKGPAGRNKYVWSDFGGKREGLHESGEAPVVAGLSPWMLPALTLPCCGCATHLGPILDKYVRGCSPPDGLQGIFRGNAGAVGWHGDAVGEDRQEL